MEYLPFETPEEEAEWISTEIAQAVQNGAHPMDFAVLARGATRVQFVVKALENLSLPVGKWFGVRYPSQARKAIEICSSVTR